MLVTHLGWRQQRIARIGRAAVHCGNSSSSISPAPSSRGKDVLSARMFQFFGEHNPFASIFAAVHGGRRRPVPVVGAAWLGRHGNLNARWVYWHCHSLAVELASHLVR
jgi:hypothetical protein